MGSKIYEFLLQKQHTSLLVGLRQTNLEHQERHQEREEKLKESTTDRDVDAEHIKV
jgi:hypothetical protein